MGNFLSRLVDRTLGSGSGIEPLIPSTYANAPGGGCGDLPDVFQAVATESLAEDGVETAAGQTSSRITASTARREARNKMPASESPSPPDLNGKRHNNMQFDSEGAMTGDDRVPPVETRFPHKDIEQMSSPEANVSREEALQTVNPITVPGNRPPRVDRVLVKERPVLPEASGKATIGHHRGTEIPMCLSLGEPTEEAPSDDFLMPTPQFVNQTVSSSAPVIFNGPDASPTGFRQYRQPAPPTRVTIGRIEVRAVLRPEPKAPAAEPVPKKSGPALSLEDYLKQRDGNHL